MRQTSRQLLSRQLPRQPPTIPVPLSVVQREVRARARPSDRRSDLAWSIRTLLLRRRASPHPPTRSHGLRIPLLPLHLSVLPPPHPLMGLRLDPRLTPSTSSPRHLPLRRIRCSPLVKV